MSDGISCVCVIALFYDVTMCSVVGTDVSTDLSPSRISRICESLGFRRGWTEFSVFSVITRREVVWNWRFGSTCRSRLQGSRCSSFVDILTFENGTIGSPGTSVSSDILPRNNPDCAVSHSGILNCRTSNQPVICQHVCLALCVLWPSHHRCMRNVMLSLSESIGTRRFGIGVNILSVRSSPRDTLDVKV